MSILPSPVTHHGWRQAWNVASDVLIAIALVWTLPFWLGALAFGSWFSARRASA